MHVRTQIRNAVTAALAGFTSGTVYVERANRLGPDDLPAVLVHLTEYAAQADERAMGASFGVETQQQIVCELHATGGDGLSVAEAIDAMDAEVETALAGDAGLAALLEILEPGETSYEINVEQDRVIASRTVIYVATWRHLFGAPETAEG